MRHLSIDIETYSSISLKTEGLYKYVQSPDFAVLLFAYAFDDEPVIVVDLTAGDRIPYGVLTALTDPSVIKHAFNAAFEYNALNRYFNCTLPLGQWRCTMLHALYCGYPGSLEGVGAALGLAEDKKKMSVGQALIRMFCMPCKPSKANGNRTRTLPHHEWEKWLLFKDYNARDVEAERNVEKILAAFPVPENEEQLWRLDQMSNAYGVAVDIELINGAIYCAEQASTQLINEAVSITGISNPKSVSQLKEWLSEEIDEDVDTLNKASVSSLLAGEMSSDAARRVLEIRQELAKTSVKKYVAMANSVCADGRIRGLLQFYGANRTGRWAGRLVQVQNLPRTHLVCLELARELVKAHQIDTLRMLYGSLPDTLSQLIRSALIASPGHVFLDADFSAIEARVVAWLAGEEWVLDVFRSHGKIYEATASQMFGVPIDLIKKGNAEYELRQKGKVATLALGFGGSAGALIAMGAINMGIKEEELPEIVQRWRSANKRIVDLWRIVENAAKDVVKTGRTAAVQKLIFALEGDIERRYMTIQLPSGRKLFYPQPFLAAGKFGEALYYMGLSQTKEKQTTKKWQVIDTWGGKLVENVVQAIARDCLAENIKRLHAAGYKIPFHVHDEVIADCLKEYADLKAVCKIMSQPIPWAPDLPLNAEGWVGEFYKKD